MKDDLQRHQNSEGNTANDREDYGMDPNSVQFTAKLARYFFIQLLGPTAHYKGILEEEGKLHLGFSRQGSDRIIVLSVWKDGLTMSGLEGTAAIAVEQSLRRIFGISQVG